MKAILRIGFLTVATLFMAVPNAQAIQVSYTLVEESERGNLTISDDHPTELNDLVEANIGYYLFTGSVTNKGTGLIGVRSGFGAAVSRVVDGITPAQTGGGVFDDEGGEPSDADTGVGPPADLPYTEWENIKIDTSAVGLFSTEAEVLGLDNNSDLGYLRFDWEVTGLSSLTLDAGDGFPLGTVNVERAASAAILSVTTEQTIPDGFAHIANPGNNGAISELKPASVGVESFLIEYDSSQLTSGDGNPLVQVGFEFAVSTSLEIENIDRLGNFEALFDANFSNTATLTNVTALQSDGLTPIIGASVVDAVTGQSIVASTVPEPSAGTLLLLGGCAGFIRRRRSCVG